MFASSLALVLLPTTIAWADEGVAKTLAAPSTQPIASTQPIPTAEFFHQQLSTGDWHQRQQTIHQLVALGPDAEPMMRELLQLDLDRESRKNVELAVEQMHQSRVLGPSLITLHVKDASPGEVFASIARQCSGPLPTWPDKLWNEGSWPKLTLDYDAKPFWEVVTELSKRLEVDCVSAEPQEIRMSRDSGHSPGGTCISGAFMLTADAMTFRNGMNVELSIFAEPKVVVTRSISFKLDSAVDERGNMLLPQTSRRVFGRRFRTGSRQLPMPFQRPPEEVNRIGVFKGSVTVAIQTVSQDWEIVDPISIRTPFPQGEEKTRLVDSIPVTIESFTASHGGDSYELQASIPSAWSSKGAQDEMMELIRKRLKVLDADGKSLLLGSVDARNTNDDTEISADFNRAPQPDGSSTGVPVKLIWNIPAETRSLVVPFEFKNLPINDPFN
jgi:hypothetical protein